MIASRSYWVAGILLLAGLTAGWINLARGADEKSPAAGAGREYEADQHTLFLCHYNKGVNADYAKGSPEGFKASGVGIKDVMKITSGGKGRFGEALDTGNDGDALSLGYYSSNNICREAGTIEMWIKLLNDPLDEKWGGRLFNLQGEDWNMNTLSMHIGGGKIEFYIMLYKTSGYHIVNAPILQWKKNEWHHVAATWSLLDGIVKLYFDGKLAGFHDYNGPFVWEKTPAVMYVGCWPNRDQRPAVLIDELRISDIARQEFETMGEIPKEENAQDVVPSAAFKFDFGTAKSPVCPGFIKITKASAYSGEKGYGFDKTSSLGEDDDTSGDYLTRDYIGGKGRFIVNLTNGIYNLWLLEGRWTDEKRLPGKMFKLWVGQDKKLDIDIPQYTPEWMKLYYGNMDNRYRLGQTIFERYVAKRFEPHIIEAEVRDNKLEIGFEGSLRALIIYPKEAAVDVEKEIKLLDGQRSRQSYYVEVPHVETNRLEKATLEKHNDYVVFQRSWMKRVYPQSIPAAHEITGGIEIFAARGEYEPAVFSVYPLKDLGDVRIELTDLKNEKGDIFKKDNFDARIVKYIERRQDTPLGGERMHTTDAYQYPQYYHVEPRILMPWKSVAMEKGLCRTFWITVKVPGNAAAGKYVGNIAIYAEKGKGLNLPFSVNVYPFSLDMQPFLSAMFYYGGSAFNDEYGTNFSWDLMSKELIDLREHNMNCVQVPPLGMNTAVIENAKVVLDDRNLTKFLEICLKAGYTRETPIICRPSYLCFELGAGKVSGGKEPSAAYMKVYNEVCRGIHEICVKNGFKNAIIWTTDERSQKGEEGFSLMRNLHRMFRDDPYLKDKEKVKVLVTDTGKGIYDILDKINYGLLSAGMLVPAKAERKGVGFGNYNFGQERLLWGFYPLKTEANMQMQWIYMAYRGDPYDPFDEYRRAGWGYVYPSPEGPIPTIYWEWIREGIDDARYFATLRNILEKKKDTSGGSLKTEIEKFMAEILAQVPLKTPGEILARNELWAPETHDNFRRKLAEYIMRLQDE